MRLSRRDFLIAAAIAALDADAADPSPFRVIRRPFAPEPGRDVSLLGYGGIRLPILDRQQARIDEELALKLVDYAYRHGVNYFDTGWVYHQGEGEKFFGRALKRYPRESFYLCDKMPTWLVKKPEDAKSFFEEQLRRCQVDYFDNYLLHSLHNEKEYDRVYHEFKVLEYLKEQKAAGRIRHLGFSYHGQSPLLAKILDDYPWELCVITLNALHMRWDKDLAKQLEMLNERKIPIFVMEPLGGGRAASLNPAACQVLKEADPSASPARWAFRFAASYPGVTSVMSGMSAMRWLEENVRTLSEQEYRPLADAERATYERAVDAYMKFATVPCTGCSYCLPCPYGLNIPEIFAWYNSYSGAGRLPADDGGPNDSQALRREFLASYSNVIAARGAGPEKCVTCRSCKVACPQWTFDIPTQMKMIDKTVARVRTEYVAKGGRL